MKSETLRCRFVGDFKVGDNLAFNADLLCKLIQSKEAASFNKLIILQAGAITEASLEQIIYRAQAFNREGVPNISEADRQEIEGKKIERLGAIISVMKKYKILDELGGAIYDELDTLRRYRNKVHIQVDVEIAGVPQDEEKAFTNEIRDWALRLNLRILRHLDNRYPRPADLAQFTPLVTLPNP